MSQKRPSGRRFAAFLVALSLASSAFGALVLPRLADTTPPAALKAEPTLIQQKLEDDLCPGRRHNPGT